MVSADHRLPGSGVTYKLFSPSNHPQQITNTSTNTQFFPSISTNLLLATI